MSVPSTALKRAIDYLEAALGSGAWKPGDRLPSIAALAKLADVSHVTMWKAVAACKAQGKLTAERGRWISAGPPVTPTTPPPPLSRCSRLGEEIKQAMRRDILMGRLPVTAGLINTKDLGRRYGCSYRPLHGALMQLVDEGLLQRFRRSFRPTRTSRPDSVVQFQWGADFSQFMNANMPEFVRNFQRILEKKCQEQGQQLVHSYSDPGSRAGKHRTRLAGTILWTADHAEQESVWLWSQRQGGRPVALIMPDATEASMPQKRPSRLLKTFGFDQKAAGRNLGRHLLKTGWKQVQFFTHMASAPFSQLRRQGLAEIFTSAGYRSAVQELTCSLDDFDYNEAYVAFFKEHISKAPDFIDDIPLYHILHQRAFRARLRPLIEKALATGDEAAWVGVNDVTALEIIRVLAEKDIHFPHPGIGLAGFDNLDESTHRNLTSYDFNDDLADQVLSHILHPSHFAEEFPAPVVMVQGEVVERQTLNASPAS